MTQVTDVCGYCHQPLDLSRGGIYHPGGGVRFHNDDCWPREFERRTGQAPIICLECGRAELASRWANGADLSARQLCFSCCFWMEWVERDKSDLNSVRIDGTHYHVAADDNSPAAFKGFGGRRFDIRFLDGREASTGNLWCQGTIPDRFRERLPDNAEWVRS